MRKEDLLRLRSVISVIFVMVVLLALLVSCATPPPIPTPTPTPPPPTPPPTPTQATVSISNFAFAPQTLQVGRGTTVVWTNNDSASHTIASRDNLFDSGTLSKGATFSYTFSQSGTFEYLCKIHPSMTGKIVVQ